jgi:hypothetical protein
MVWCAWRAGLSFVTVLNNDLCWLMARASTLLFFLLWLPRVAQAQITLTGQVSEAAGQPAIFATIGLHTVGDSAVVKGGITDETGHFRLTGVKPGNYFVSAQAIGFRRSYSAAFVVATEAVDVPALVLQEEARSLQEVTVKTQRTLVEQQPDRVVLNVENSVITKGNKVNDLLRYAPRVRVGGDGALSVGNKANVLILVDGRQMGQAALNSFLQNFSAEDILKVEVITNPSARYDASFGAVINIVTKRTLEQGVNGRAQLTYSQGMYERFTPDASLNWRRGRWSAFGSASLYLNAQFYSTQAIERFFPGGSLFNDMSTLDAYTSVATTWGLDYAINDRHMLGARLNTKHNRDDYNYRTDTYFRSAAARTDSILNTTNYQLERTQTMDYNLNYRGILDSAGRELSVNLTQTFFDKDATQNIRYQLANANGQAVGNPTILRILNPNEQRSFIAQADYSTPALARKAKLDVGVKTIQISNDNELRQETQRDGQYVLDPAFSSNGLYREQTYAAYSTLSRQWPKGWSGQVGLRYETTTQTLTNSDLQRTYAGLFPSLSLTRAVEGGGAWGITYSRKIARPSLGSLVPYRYLVDRYTYAQGNPLIRPSFANTLDAYYSLRSGITLFANATHHRDYMTQILTTDPATRIYTQTDGNLQALVEVYGGVTVPKNITRWWQTNSTLMLLMNHANTPVNELSGYTGTGTWLSLNSTNIFVLPHNWKAELTFSYQSASRAALWTQQPFYWASFSINKAILNDMGNLRLELEDVFRTQRYRVAANYGVVNLTSQGYNDNQRLRVSFSFNFGKKTVKAARQTDLGNNTEKGRMGAK